MEAAEIRNALSSVAEHFTAHPEDAKSEDKPATAFLESGLRIRVEGPGQWIVTTDMPSALGGEGSAPSPGWLRRAAQAACDATMVAIRAAQEGIALDSLRVIVGSVSDDRGLLGLADAHAGPTESWARIEISAKGVSPDKLREIVQWAEAHSPVTDAVCRPIPHRLEIAIL
jgi:uncharacterized OsmC-like protein